MSEFLFQWFAQRNIQKQLIDICSGKFRIIIIIIIIIINCKWVRTPWQRYYNTQKHKITHTHTQNNTQHIKLQTQ
jgi:hypothetical protein